MIFDKEKLLIIAGPCSLESKEISFEVAEKLSAIQKRFTKIKIVFKGSFDKANRTSIFSNRGLGIDKGIQLLSDIKNKFNLLITTDFHVPEQAKRVGEVCDMLQIPAFLCRQTDMLIAAAQTGKTISVKKGQFLSPNEMKHVVLKLEESNAAEIIQMERGTTFGYNNLVVDMRSFAIMKTHGHPTIFDATHSVQMPGAGYNCTTGTREFIPNLACAAIAAGADGLFFETHPCPEKATCDTAIQIALKDLEDIIMKCLKIWELMNQFK